MVKVLLSLPRITGTRAVARRMIYTFVYLGNIRYKFLRRAAEVPDSYPKAGDMHFIGRNQPTKLSLHSKVAVDFGCGISARTEAEAIGPYALLKHVLPTSFILSVVQMYISWVE